MIHTIITARPAANTPAAAELANFRNGLHNKSDEELREMLKAPGATDMQIQAIKDELAARSGGAGAADGLPRW